MIKKRNFKSIVAVGVITLASATLLAACGSKSTSSKDEINWYTPTEILTLDISKNTDHYSALALGNSESNLLRVDKDGKLQPDLAKKVDVSADGLTYTATLRDDLKYSDGTKLTAEDFVYTWQRMVDPATASEYAYLASDSHLVNAADIIAGKKSVDELGVKAEGNKVIFTLSNPSPQFKSLLSFSNFVPQHKEFVEKTGKQYGTKSDKQIYSGPFKIGMVQAVASNLSKMTITGMLSTLKQRQSIFKRLKNLIQPSKCINKVNLTLQIFQIRLLFLMPIRKTKMLLQFQKQQQVI